MSVINGNYREYKLDNGLFVALQETPTNSVGMKLRVLHGSLNEKKGEEGIAHLLEHILVMGGTKKFSPKEALKLSCLFGSGEGDSFNAVTDLDQTYFTYDILPDHIPLSLEHSSEMVFNPLFNEKKVEEEKKIVLREAADYKSEPSYKDNRNFFKALFGNNSPHVYDPLGKEQAINSVSVRGLKNFQKRGYNPNNMGLFIVGALPEGIEAHIEKYFGSYNSGEGKRFEFPRNTQLENQTIIHTSAHEYINHGNPQDSTAHLSMGFYAPTRADEDNYAMDMLVTVLGGGMNSRLFKNIRQKRGLAYDVTAYYNGKNNKGMFIVGGGIQSTKAEEAIDAFFEEMAILREELVSTENLDRIKMNWKYNVAKNYDTNQGHIKAIELKKDRGLTTEHILDGYNKVTPEMVREAAQKYFPVSREEGKYVMLLRDPLKE